MEIIKQQFIQHIRKLQDDICSGLEQADEKARFEEDEWQRPGGGGGRTRVIQNGNVFEKGGVNISEVEGDVTPVMRQQLNLKGDHFFAAGISLVIHPVNPFVPTVHANFRYFEMYDTQKNVIDSWFGGGADLTPYYLMEEDAIHFHQTLKDACDKYDTGFFPLFKKRCDEYFVNSHRGNECRGIGGIFFDHCRPDTHYSAAQWLAFATGTSESFLPAYLPIVKRRKGMNFDAANKYWQEIRRGRYVEFNLVHDRGTLFGLKTHGRTESILMSLPPTVRFDYNYQPEPGSAEDQLLQVCLHPRDWV